MALKNSVNPNEENYIGGKKHFKDVLKNSGDGNLLIWRQPEEDFNNNSILIVEPGEEAIFVNNGQIVQVFKNGRYKLHTNNYPFISRLQMKSHGGVSSYNCLVYFVRKAHTQEIFWGTDSPIQVRDKVMGIATTLRARGSYKIQIDNPALFLEKLVGNNIQFKTQEELNSYFVNEFQSKIKSRIAQYIENSEKEVLGIDARLEEISEKIQPVIQEVVGKYGLLCINFSIASIDIADDVLRKAYDEAFIRKHQKVVNAEGEKEVIDVLGDDWGRVQAKDLLSSIAENNAGGAAAAAGAGLGMGMAAGNAFNALASQAFSASPQGNFVQPTGSGRFVQDNGTGSKSSKDDDPVEAFEQLKTLLDKGYINQDEYDQRRKSILDAIQSKAIGD